MKIILKCLVFLLSLNTFYSQSFQYLDDKQSIPRYYVATQKWIDGTSMSDKNVDGYIYKKNASKYYVLDDFIQGNIISASLFGVKGDGVTDDSKSLQKAFDIATKYGLSLYLPYGTMIVSEDLIINMGNKAQKIKITGAGVSNTIIRNVSTNTRYALKITGDYFNNLDIKDFRIERDLASPVPTGNVGLCIEKQVYATMENIEVIRFKQGIEIIDVSTLYMKNVNARFCGNGYFFSKLENNGQTNPNLIEMHSCVATSNTKWGMVFVNGHSVNFYNSLFEDNFEGGINFSYDGTNGLNSLNVNGCYFEGNKGTDVLIKSSAPGTHNFIGNTFNRVSDKKFTTNSILLDAKTKGKNLNMLNLIGNGFFNASSYKSSSERKSVKVIADDYNLIKVFDSNIYSSDIDKPNYHQNIRISTK